MSFAAPLFLLAALAAAIPIVLHMINRQKAKELPFATLRFLKISVQKTRRRKRIHDLLLMLLRAAVLLLIAAGLARPAVTNLSAMWGGAETAAVIILDNSASMGTIDPDRIRFDTAMAAVGQVLDQLAEGDQVALLPTNGPLQADADKLERTQDAARRVLSLCRVSYERANLGLKVLQARELLANSDAPNKQIYIVCDMQKVSWEGAGGEATEKENTKKSDKPNSDEKENERPVTVVIVDCNRTPKPDVAVQGVDLESVVPIAGLPVKATATLLNASTVPRQPRVELLIDGVREAGSPEIALPPGGRDKHEFVFRFKQGGLHRGEVRLVGDDGSKYNDRRWFAMQVDESIPVAIVRSRRHEIPYLDDSYYLEQALLPGDAERWAVETTNLTTADLLSAPLEKYKVIFCVNLPAPSAEIANRLGAYVAGGGNLLWIGGDNVDAAAYNRMNEEAKGQLLPAPLVGVRAPGPDDHRDSWRINFLDKTFPAFRQLVEPSSLYESVLVYKHVRMAPAEGEARVLARLDDGEPLLAMREIGKGKTLFFGATVHVNWTNFPLRPIFLPLIARLTFDLAEVEQKYHNALAGQPLVLNLPEETRTVGVEVVPPGGETLRLKTESVEGQPGQTFRYGDTYDIGVYLLRLLDAARPAPIAYAVNLDPDESDPAKMSREELQKRFGTAPLVFAENPDDLSSTFAFLREGKSLWGFFLSAVLVVLVFESLVSNRLSPKQDESLQELPPGMRRLGKKG